MQPPPRSDADETSLVQVLLEQQRLMQEREEKMATKVRQLEEKLEPAEAITAQQVTALQLRLAAAHAAELLSDDELYALEDIVVDYLELKPTMGAVVTLEMVCMHEKASKLLKLISMSEGVVADGTFARSARRKYV
jgi:hypothetical protein